MEMSQEDIPDTVVKPLADKRACMAAAFVKLRSSSSAPGRLEVDHGKLNANSSVKPNRASPYVVRISKDIMAEFDKLALRR